MNLSLDELKNVSDGYHTFSELYDQRSVLYLLLVKIYTSEDYLINAWYKPDHYPNYDCVYLQRVNCDGEYIDKSQVSFHVHIKYREMYEDAIGKYTPGMHPEYDGHTKEEVLERLRMRF